MDYDPFILSQLASAQFALGPYVLHIWSRTTWMQVHTSEAEAAKAKERVVGKVSRSALIKARKHYESLRVPLHAQKRSALRPFHQKSTCLTQLTFWPYVVQIWSLSLRISAWSKPSNSNVWTYRLKALRESARAPPRPEKVTPEPPKVVPSTLR